MSLTTWYCSGASQLADMLGLADAQHPLGVCIPVLSAPARRALRDLDVPAFLDTGAFSEVEIGPGGPVVTRPMDEATWDRITVIGLELVRARRASTLLVAPDRVGDQAVTIERLARWAGRMREAEDAGAVVVLPCQRGAMPLHVFAREAIAAAGLRAPALGIPGNKAAASPLEVGAVVSTSRPAALHLLGCGPERRHTGRLVAAARRAGHAGPITCDSSGIVALVGRANGPGGRPRPLTAAQDEEVELAEEACFRGGYGPDYTDEIGDVVSLLGPVARRRLRAELARVGYAPGEDLGNWVRERWDDPVVAHVADRAWATWHAAATRGIARRRAVARTFSVIDVQLGLPLAGAA